jgi:hypothetical protein
MDARANAHDRPDIRYAWCGPSVLVVDTRLPGARRGVADRGGGVHPHIRYVARAVLVAAHGEGVCGSRARRLWDCVRTEPSMACEADG